MKNISRLLKAAVATALMGGLLFGSVTPASGADADGGDPAVSGIHLPSLKSVRSASGMRSIKIGCVISLTGAYATEGRQTKEGYDFWRDYVNTHGGLRVGDEKYRVNLVYMDDGSIPNVTAAMTLRLIDSEHVQFLLGPYGSKAALASAAVAERKGIPVINSAGALDKIYDQGYKNVFSVTLPARVFLEPLVSFGVTHKPRARRAAIIAADDPVSLEEQQGAIQAAVDHKIEVAVADIYAPGEINFTGLVQRIAEAHVDMILDAGHLSDALLLQKALADGNIHAKLIGYATAADFPLFNQELGALAGGVMQSAQWSSTIRDKGGPEFYRTPHAYAAAFRRRFHHDANYHNAAASAAGLALELALKRAHSASPEAVRHALAQLNVNTFYGRIKFDARGVNIGTHMVVQQLRNGRMLTVSPKKSSNAVPKYPILSARI